MGLTILNFIYYIHKPPIQILKYRIEYDCNLKLVRECDFNKNDTNKVNNKGVEASLSSISYRVKYFNFKTYTNILPCDIEKHNGIDKKDIE